MTETIYASCGICGNESGFDEESLKASTYNINGTEIVLCCPCEDDLRRLFIRNNMSDRDLFEDEPEIKILEELSEDEQMEVVNWYAETINTIDDVPLKEVNFWASEYREAGDDNDG